jgi:hypothetical protein
MAKAIARAGGFYRIIEADRGQFPAGARIGMKFDTPTIHRYVDLTAEGVSNAYGSGLMSLAPQGPNGARKCTVFELP